MESDTTSLMHSALGVKFGAGRERVDIFQAKPWEKIKGWILIPVTKNSSQCRPLAISCQKD